MTELGSLLRELRSRAGLTQEQLAEKSGISVRTIRRLERGQRFDHRMTTVHRLADALGASPQDRGRLTQAAGTAQGPEGDQNPPREEGGGPGAGEEASRDAAPVTPVRAPSRVRGLLAEAVDELAREVRRRQRREEDHRRVHDPFALPVRWRPATQGLVDSDPNIQRLGPGAAPADLRLTGELTGVATVYRRIPSGRLVVLGRAGAGKSVLVIRFVLDLLDAFDRPAPPDGPASPAPATWPASPDGPARPRASEAGDPYGRTSAVYPRVPVIFSIGSWDPRTDELPDWLAAQLLRDHPHLARRLPSGAATLAEALIAADAILPVLDGFDEIAEGLRPRALEELNNTSMPLVLTSRGPEYAEAVQALGPLAWAAAVELDDLTVDDLADYLPRTDRHAHGGGATAWTGVLQRLRTEGDEAGARLARALSTPLMITLARTLYSDTHERDPAELLDVERFPDPHALEEHLLAGFAPAVYRRGVPQRPAAGPPGRFRWPGRRNRRTGWDADRAQHWLGHLAHALAGPDRDRQDLAWWQIGDSLQHSTCVTAVVLASSVCITVVSWAIGVFSAVPLGQVLLQGALMGPAAGIAFGCAYAITARLGGAGVFGPAITRLRLPHAGDAVRRPGRTVAARLGAVLIGGAVMGIGYALGVAVEVHVVDRVPLTDPVLLRVDGANMVIFGLIYGTSATAVFGLLTALEAPLDIASAANPLSLLAENRATVLRQLLVLAPLLTLAIAFGGRLVVLLLNGPLGPLHWSLADGLRIGATGGIGGALAYTLAFTAWGRWLLLTRLWLPLTGKLPWDTAAFLDDAYHRGILRQSGAVYQFRHLRLQHHLGRLYRSHHPSYTPAEFAPSRPL
ncbi:helix-turn-helix transcriptional regulator [Streptomyces sp. NPDC005828]|uniref:helix-turn-helix transcriptional regulator n=1 Tax=Streptomyces sp. NPDC005828 TaxID=3157071 RepID=UPI0033FA7D2E